MEAYRMKRVQADDPLAKMVVAGNGSDGYDLV